MDLSADKTRKLAGDTLAAVRLGGDRVNFPPGKTLRWDIPRQIPVGPHRGKWCVSVPADMSRTYQRDPHTGEITDRQSPEWARAEIVENDPSWWPSAAL